MRALTIDASFDLICPWCLIGKRQLERALEALRTQAPDALPRVRWRGQVLLPDVPEEGWPFRAFYLHRLSSQQAVLQRQAQVREAGQAVGLSFEFERIDVMPSTRMAHRMVANTTAVYGAAMAERLIEALFAAYFQQGQDIGQIQVLTQLAQDLGIDHLVVNAAEEGGSAYLGWRAEQAIMTSQEKGVPHFVFNGEVEVQGAVHHDVLLSAMMQALAQHQASSLSPL